MLLLIPSHQHPVSIPWAFQGAGTPGTHAAGSLGAALGPAQLLIAVLSLLTAVPQPRLPTGLRLPGKEPDV